eukprot:TRINITY_DN9823_c0_g1_i7.p1 TRINITY_DN9823_c0_g1~~TRINITY_DN9823_c0_g1_i7.p1  ORF type:complete len:862 (-),score=198.22 TRINITY_DN9823_c0_g1_i7:131-2716(-)
MQLRSQLPPPQGTLTRPGATAGDGSRFGAPPLPGRNTCPPLSLSIEPAGDAVLDMALAMKTGRVPAPPPKPRGGAVHRPGRPQARGCNAKGMAMRSAIKEAVSTSRPGPSGRWGSLKVLFTELINAVNGTSVKKLLMAVAEAKALGASDWPEFLKAQERLAALQQLQEDLRVAGESSVDIETMEQLLTKAEDLGVRARKNAPNLITQADEFSSYCGNVEHRIQRLSKLRSDLVEASKACDLNRLKTSLWISEELGVKATSMVGPWNEVYHARIRHQRLEKLMADLWEAVSAVNDDEGVGDDDNNESSAKIKVMLEEVVNRGISIIGADIEPPAPLSLAFSAAKRRLAHLRLEGLAGLRTRLRREMSRAADDGNIPALRAAVAEADRQQHHVASFGMPEVTQWAALEGGKRRLGELVALEAEFESLLSCLRPFPPAPGAFAAAFARADALGCSNWTLCQRAKDRQEELQSMEVEILQALEAGSSDHLSGAVLRAERAGLSSWPLLHAARLFVQGTMGKEADRGDSTDNWRAFSSSWAAQRLLLELTVGEPSHSGHPSTVSSVWRQEVAHVGIALDLEEGKTAQHLAGSAVLESFKEVSGQVSMKALRLTEVGPDLVIAEFQMMSVKGSPAYAAIEHLCQSLAALNIAEVKLARILYSQISVNEAEERQLLKLQELQLKQQDQLSSELRFAAERQMDATFNHLDEETSSIGRVLVRSPSGLSAASNAAEEIYSKSCQQLVEAIVSQELGDIRLSPDIIDHFDLEDVEITARDLMSEEAVAMAGMLSNSDECRVPIIQEEATPGSDAEREPVPQGRNSSRTEEASDVRVNTSSVEGSVKAIATIIDHIFIGVERKKDFDIMLAY